MSFILTRVALPIKSFQSLSAMLVFEYIPRDRAGLFHSKVDYLRLSRPLISPQTVSMTAALAHSRGVGTVSADDDAGELRCIYRFDIYRLILERGSTGRCNHVEHYADMA